MARYENDTLYDFMLGAKPVEHSSQPWFIDSVTGETRTRADVKQRTDALALGMQTHLFGETGCIATTKDKYNLGPVVSIFALNDIDFPACVWACHKLGCAVAPTNGSSTADEYAHQLRLANATAIIAHPGTLEKALEAGRSAGIPAERIILLARGKAHELQEIKALHVSGLRTIDELIEMGITSEYRGAVVLPLPTTPKPRVAFICFSSGTSGLPKAVVVPHSSVISNTLQTSGAAIPGSRAAPGDKALGLVPLTHMFGLLMLSHVCPYLGISVVVLQQMPSFEKFLNLLESQQINHLILAPPLVNAFLKHPATKGRNFSYFKSCVVAAAPLDADREEEFRDLCGPQLLMSQAYGMTETAGMVTGMPEGVAPSPGSVGHLLPGIRAKIVDPNGNVVKPGFPGELLIKGPQLCLGYLENDEANSTAFDADGYFRTGDEVEIQGNGAVFITDRLKHIIKHKGFQISPTELEGYLMHHRFVQDVGVVGQPDERAGETPVAFVVLTPEGKAQAEIDSEKVKEELKELIRANKSQYKWLGAVYFIEAIPKLVSGKILARELKKLLPVPAVKVPLVPAVTAVPSVPVAVPSMGSSGDSQSKISVLDEKTEDPEKFLPVLGKENNRFANLELELGKLAREKRKEKAPTALENAWEWLTLYRCFFTVFFTLNAVGCGLTLAHKWDIGREYVATFSLSNIVIAILARNEVFLRILYTFFRLLFSRWPPYWFRNSIARLLLHFGGIHSGFASSGTLWLIVAMIEFFRQGPSLIHPAILAFSILAVVLLLSVMASAYPDIRNNHHNFFENTHRLAGWTGLAVLWILVGLADSWNTAEQRFIGHQLAHKPDIYLAIFLSCCIIYPWTTLRKQPVKSEVLSPSIIILRFPGGVKIGLFGRVSHHPLKENHAFGITSEIPTGTDKDENYMVVVGQGDFTRDLIANPPTHMWTRNFKFVGLPYMWRFYRSGVYLVTGSAIGVAMSVFLQRDPRSKWHLLWVCGNIEKTYGNTVVKQLKDSYTKDGILEEDEYNASVTMWDTRIKGRPNIMDLVSTLVEQTQAEVVFVTSNPQGTADTIRACRRKGISCHGPVWDS